MKCYLKNGKVIEVNESECFKFHCWGRWVCIYLDDNKILDIPIREIEKIEHDRREKVVGSD